ncbi:SAM-dependent methyltransferase [Pectobacterium phage DU_PP_II]|uniref:Serine recombinase n=1 Tax=Pectobacterium phage DU_PP_II TaxID=2041489 RepID=A0A2D2W5U2_9CAUD|nr:SAM-dependent methyltransferase [Pectobacterium phage DU_PP_II]ATS93668.1 serine recombinase [Pectobacterium phage DU_PP_II]
MIHTKEPANVQYVLLSAFRSVYDPAVNLMLHKALVAQIMELAGCVIESTALTGCYLEAGQQVPSTEKTIRVRCEERWAVGELVWLACHKYEQDCVLVYESQTHTASLQAICEFTHLGTFQKAPDGTPAGAYTIDENGEIWICR